MAVFLPEHLRKSETYVYIPGSTILGNYLSKNASDSILILEHVPQKKITAIYCGATDEPNKIPWVLYDTIPEFQSDTLWVRK